MSKLLVWENAEKALRNRDVTQARSAYQSLLSVPAFAAPAHLRLSLLEGGLGSSRLAAAHALSAFAAREADPDLLEMLCKRLLSVGEFRLAVESAEEMVACSSVRAGACAELGKLMLDAFMPDVALGLLDQAMCMGLDTPGVRYLAGLARFYRGEFAPAERDLEYALEKDQNLAPAYWALSKLQRQDPDGKQVQRVRHAIDRAKNSPDKSLLLYALFKRLDDQGDVDGAWKALEQGMRLKRETLRYDPAAELRLHESLLKEASSVGSGCVIGTDITPIFIVGLPRTGSTLLEVMLSSHPDIAMGGELHDAIFQMRWVCDQTGGPHLDLRMAQAANRADPREYGERYLDHVRWRARGQRYITDKMPENFKILGHLARALPEAIFIHVTRNPADVCFSNLKELFSSFYPHSYDQIEMADHYVHYRHLMAHWHRCFPGRILDVAYEDLVFHSTSVMKKVLDFCGVSGVDGFESGSSLAMGTIATASAGQVRDSIHGRYVQQWRRYEGQLQPLLERLSIQGIDTEE